MRQCQLLTGFIFQQDGASAHTARSAAQRTKLAERQLSRFHHKRPMASKFAKYKPMDYHVWGAILEAYCKLKTKLKTSAELKEALQVIWGNLPQGPIEKAVKDFSK